MVIKTFKTSKAELFIILIGLICFIATLWYIISSASAGAKSTSSPPSAAPEHILTNARTADDRVKFLSQFGWEIDPDPLDVREVTIPGEFDEVFSDYNDIQKPLGFDLERYKGCNVKKYSYSVTNYPDGVRNVRATLLIAGGRVIGGDISGGGARKFTHSFRLAALNEDESASEEVSSLSSE